MGGNETLLEWRLGLSLVRKIIEGYGGKIWVENRIENDYKRGSNFIVLLEHI